MYENYCQFDDETTCLRHAELQPGRRTFLFLHGIGDSSLSYLSFLASSNLSQFNILVPDFLGCGKSSGGKDYSFKRQVDLVIAHISQLEKELAFSFADIILVPHSMAGIHAMLLCESQLASQIGGIINVEGSVTQYGSFISEKVASVDKTAFPAWFDEFREVTIFEKFIQQFPVCRSYYASLKFCQREAFLQNALEIYQYCHADTGKYTNLAGNKFVASPLAKVYCYGSNSLCHESLEFLQEHHVPLKVFDTNNHFVMQQCFDEFVKFIVAWK